MSSFNCSSIFVCCMCIFFICVDGSPLNDIFKQTQSAEVTVFSLTDYISEILSETTTLENFKTERTINTKPLCKSVLTTLTDPEEIESLFRLTVQDLIRNSQQIIIRNIFTSLDLCLKQFSGKDSHSLQNELKNMIFGNDKVPLDLNTSGTYDMPMNFGNDFSTDLRTEGTSEETSLVSGYELVPRNLDSFYTYVPAEESDPEYSSKKRIVKQFDDGDDIKAHLSSRDNSRESIKGTGMGAVKGGRKFFLFENELPKPEINEDLNKKLFLFKKGNDGVDSNNSDGGVKYKGQKTHFLFDDYLPQVSFSEESQSNDKFATGFNY